MIFTWPFGRGSGGSTPPQPSTPTLIVADGGDATGTATIGAQSGTTNTLYAAPFAGLIPSAGSWVQVGSRTGPGTISLTGYPLGSYIWFVLSSFGGPDNFSNYVIQPLTNTSSTACVGSGGLPAPTVAIMDNANGTGCNVQISQSAYSSMVHTAWIMQSDRPNTWVSTSSRTGDGSIDISVGQPDVSPYGVNLTNCWVVQIRSSYSGDTACSDLMYCCPTLGLNSPHYQILAAMHTYLVKTQLSGIAGRVYRAQNPSALLQQQINQYPVIAVTPTSQEDRRKLTQFSTAWTYPVTIGVVDKEPDYAGVRLEQHLAIRQAFIDLFDRKPLLFSNPAPAQVAGASIIDVAPRPIIEQASDLWLYSSIICNVRVDRVIVNQQPPP